MSDRLDEEDMANMEGLARVAPEEAPNGLVIVLSRSCLRLIAEVRALEAELRELRHAEHRTGNKGT